ncbi:MAG: hypothetical protein R2910_07855 [Gemmatimonadales bacterium]
MSTRILPHVLLGAVATLTACNDPSSVDSPYIVTPVTTTALAGTPGWPLNDTLVVEVRDAEGHLVPGAKVTWSLPSGGRLAVQLADAEDRMTGTTDSDGHNYAVWTLGLDEGTQVAKVAAGFGEPVTFAASATVLHAVSVSVASGYTCAVLSDNRPVCWGQNQYGQLGTGDTLARATPTPVVGLPAVQEIQVSNGYGAVTCARDLAGDVWCWGYDPYGAGGPAASEAPQLLPSRVAGAEGAVSLALGPQYGGHTCAVFPGGGAKCWGYNGTGMLGTGDLVSSASPRTVIGNNSFSRVFASDDLTCALDSDGEVWCWGNVYNQLSPLPYGIYTSPVRPVPGYRFVSLAISWYGVCGIQPDGSTSCFGDWSATGRPYPPPTRSGVTTEPVHPDLQPNLAEIGTDGARLMFGLSRYGETYFWGEYWENPDPTSRVIQRPRFVKIAGGYYQFCGIAESGGLYCGNIPRYQNPESRISLFGVPSLVNP